ncbi:MAG TPA: amino acid permease, partial [Acidobacteriota bacterium]|nr:amino acid permease [Acidobacteriota bacterium]
MATEPTSPTVEKFKSVLSLWDLILFGIAFIGPTAPYAMFGIGTTKSLGHLPLVYLIAMVAMSFTAISYGRMALAFPQAGSTYTYSSKALTPVVGFFAGWGMILDYILIPLLSVIFVSLTLNKILPELPYFIWVLISAAAITGVNLRGIQVTARANYVLNAIMGASLVWFIAMAVRCLLGGTGAATLWSIKPFYNSSTFDFDLIMGATSIVVLSYIGFDGVTTLSEDAKNPKRDVWRATVLVCFIAGGLFVLQTYLAQLVWPDYTTFHPVETAFMDIGRLVGGESLFYLISFVLMVGGFASAITGQASASRLLAGMGRDRLLPYRIFGHIHPKLGTPVNSILLMGVLQLIGAVLLKFAEVAELVNFGAFIGFMLVNVSVISHYYLRLGERRGVHVALNLALPLAGFGVCLFIWIHLSAFSLAMGATWMGLGFLYLVYLTRGFSRKL